MNFKLDPPDTLRGVKIEQRVQVLEDYCHRLRKELLHFTENIDENNFSKIIKIKAAQIGSVYAESVVADTTLINVNMTVGSGNDIFKVDKQGIYLGNAEFNKAPFSVDMEGNLYATNAYIEGKIASSEFIGGTITGGTITGAMLRTDFPGNKRIEISGTGLVCRNTSDQKHGVCIDVDGNYSKIEFFNNESLIGSIGLDGAGNYNIIGSDINIYNGSPIGTWNCSGANFTYLRESSGNYYATENWVTANFSPLGHSHSYAEMSDIFAAIAAHEAAYH
mgnify:FL=1